MPEEASGARVSRHAVALILCGPPAPHRGISVMVTQLTQGERDFQQLETGLDRRTAARRFADARGPGHKAGGAGGGEVGRYALD